MELLLAPACAVALIALASLISFISTKSTSSYTGPVEASDGTPIAADAFWLRMRRRKAALAGLLVMVLALRCFSLGWAVALLAGGSKMQRHVASDLGWLLSYVVALTITLFALSTRSVSTHWRQTMHLCALFLSIMAVHLARFLLALVGERTTLGGSPTRHPDRLRYRLADALTVLDIIIVLVATITVLSTPKSPHLHHEPRQLTGEQRPSKADELSNGDPANVSPLAWCSPASHLLFNWAGPLLAVGAARDQLGADDIPFLKASFRASVVFEAARRRFSQAQPAPQTLRWVNPLVWRLVVLNRRAVLLQIALAVVVSGIYYLPAAALNQLVSFLENRTAEEGASKSLVAGWAYVIFLFVALLLDAIIEGQLWYISNAELTSRIRTQLNTLIFDKTLRRKDIVANQASSEPASDSSSVDERAHGEQDADAFSFTSRGAIMNLFSVDCDRCADFPTFSFSLIDCPLEILIGTVFLYRLLGVAAIIGIAVNIFFVPLNHYASKAFATTQDALMSARDRRVASTSEALQAIRMLKFSASEQLFEDRILEGRAAELKQLKRNFYLEVAFNFLWALSPVLSTVLAFWWYTAIQGNALTPSKAFTSLAVFQELRFALNSLPDVLISVIQALVSVRRIQAFLDSPDVAVPPERSSHVDDSPAGQAMVALRDATVTWPAVSHDDYSSPSLGARTPRRAFLLADVSLTFPNGQLSLICGPLGSGKSLLLNALLGEADVLAGQVLFPRSAPDAIAAYTDQSWAQPTASDWLTDQCAYVPQTAWMQNASVEANILFGLPMLRERYEAVLEACSLVKDLHILEDGDATEIGERGVNLSGGQKARISLARAVYSRASYLLLDDVLSAVDAHTADHLVSRCLKGPLMDGRTILLVSHHTQLCLPIAAFAVLLENGALRFAGPAAELARSPYMHSILGTSAEEEVAPDATHRPGGGQPIINKNLQHVRPMNGTSSASSSAASSDDETESESESEDEPEKAPRKLVEDEARAVGHVDRRVWYHYTSANGSMWFWLAFATVFVGANLIDVGETWWLRIWSGSYEAGSPSMHSVNYYLAIYAAISVVNVAFETARYLVLYRGALNASSALYRQLLHSVLRAPLRIFDTVPLGRLLNRFAKDMEGIDSQLPDNIGRAAMYALSILTTIVAITAVAPPFLLGFALISGLYYTRGALYTQTARELRRLDSITKSPLFTSYSEAISGVAVIRAFGASHRFMSFMLWRAEHNLQFFYHLWVANRWLSIRFSLLSTLVICLTAVILLQTRAPAALAGFALTYALSITSDLLFVVRRWTALELSMVAVERVKEYAEIEQEAPAIVEPRPPASWPHKGDVSVEKLCIRYSEDLPDVLHDVAFDVAGGSKIGIVGATGCGKSTLALSFFRFVEAHTGRIVIDGLDISNVGLQDLRSRLTIIPQDPTILSGTLRSALDTAGEHDDIELYDALRRVHLLPPIDSPQAATATADGENVNAFQNLDTPISEQGANLSQGQRQLVCMARALLKRSKIVLLDEATSNVDYKTDELITQTVSTEFPEATLLVIAHRLRTIIMFDRVLLLDAGHVIEYAAPSTLLSDPTSRFYQLCQATGKREFKILTRMAKDGKRPQRPLPRPRKSRKSVPGSGEKKRTVNDEGKYE